MFQRHIKIVLTFALVISACRLVAQVTDDFSDGNFTANPVWRGTDAQFVVNSSLQLQLQSSGEGSSWLSTGGYEVGNTEWRCWIKLSFSPSDNNNALVYLAAEQADISSQPDGIYLKLGESGSADAIRLIAREGGTDHEICSGPVGQIAASFALQIKVVRDETGQYQLFTAGDGQSFSLQATGNDTYIPSGQWFGWLCKYTSSNATKFYLDDVYAGPPVVDLTPPELLSVVVDDSHTLTLTFSESLDQASAGNTANYTVTPGNIHPQTASPQSATVSLVFANPFDEGVVYTLTADGVADLSLNPCANQSLSFSIVVAGTGDVVISEIMADPDPPVALPNYEYVELYNTTNAAIDITGWTLITGSTQRPISSGVIEPGGYIIVCKADAVASLSPYGNTTSLTSLTLTNTGQSLQLLDASGALMDSVTYSLSWYADSQKEDGGWSLEMISPVAACLGSSNWHASLSSEGGTPGAANTVAQLAGERPVVDNVEVTAENSVALTFSQPMDAASLTDVGNYLLSASGYTANPTEAVSPASDQVVLSFADPFADGVSYGLTVKSTLTNCVGTGLVTDTTLSFGKPAPAGTFDVVISEIMADPEPVVGLPAEEYFELHNRSVHAVDLSGWSVTIGSTVKTFSGGQLAAGSYGIVVASANASLFGSYGQVITVSSMSLTNDGATLVLRDATGTLIHAVEYDAGWYGNSAKSGGGWSLEMIDPANPCAGAANWTASRDASGGTPGRQNSVYGSNPDNSLALLLRADYITEEQARLIFSEPADSLSAARISRYTISPGDVHPLAALPVAPLFEKVTLTFPTPMEEGVIYTISVSDSVTDCAGNQLQALSTARVAVPSEALPGEVAINELLTNPAGDGSDYLELYNTTEKTIDLSSMGITYQSATSSDQKTVFLPGYLLFPDGYALLSRDPDQLADRYTILSPGNLILFDNLPDFSSTGGVLYIHPKEDESTAIDSLVYDEDMHSPLLTSTDGVSLERVNPLRPATDRTNWQSAGAAAGYGTPGYRNSQYNANPVTAGELVCEPHVFSPDGDGRDDVTSIALRLDEPGYMATIGIYDASGRRVAVPVNNELAGTDNVWSWNGITSEGNEAASGIYLVLAEVVNPDGKTGKIKATVVVTRR